MDANHFLQITLTVTGFILTATLSILAFFIKKWIDSVDLLAKTVQSLEKAFVEQKATHNNMSEQSAIHHKFFYERIDELSEQIADNTHKIEKNSEDIAALKGRKR